MAIGNIEKAKKKAQLINLQTHVVKNRFVFLNIFLCLAGIVFNLLLNIEYKLALCFYKRIVLTKSVTISQRWAKRKVQLSQPLQLRNLRCALVFLF